MKKTILNSLRKFRIYSSNFYRQLNYHNDDDDDDSTKKFININKEKTRKL